ncbi:MAG: hypothetical protein GXP15_12360 [Gammaproteobacteria bacterium]|nr:hypothetical protein [Gammaproteobacteria bacterium]
MIRSTFSTITMAACLILFGCSTNVSRFQMPGTDLSHLRTFYVRPPADDAATLELYAFIKTDLEERGFRVVRINDNTVYGEAGARFDIKADWHWDLTPYLLELRVAIYDPADNTLIAQAQSLQSSLVRKRNETVVRRAIAILFDDPLPSTGEKL